MKKANTNRIIFLTTFLNQISTLRPRIGNPENIFELYCYSIKLLELSEVGMTLTPRNVNHSIFTPHFNPGEPYTASYFSIQNKDNIYNLVLNGKFYGLSKVKHSPDIVLLEKDTERILSIYECKHYSRPLPLGIYREFIGYMNELRIPKHNATLFQGIVPILRPTIYTSGFANTNGDPMLKTWNFDVIDNL